MKSNNEATVGDSYFFLREKQRPFFTEMGCPFLLLIINILLRLCTIDIIGFIKSHCIMIQLKWNDTEQI